MEVSAAWYFSRTPKLWTEGASPIRPSRLLHKVFCNGTKRYCGARPLYSKTVSCQNYTFVGSVSLESYLRNKTKTRPVQRHSETMARMLIAIHCCLRFRILRCAVNCTALLADVGTGRVRVNDPEAVAIVGSCAIGSFTGSSAWDTDSF